MTASLGELASVLDRVRVERTPKALRGLRPELFWRSYRELLAIPPLHIQLDDCRQGRLIRAELGIGMIRFAMELPASFDDWVASHNRANNLRKSMRRASRAGISFAIVEDERGRAAVLTTLLRGWGGQLPDGIGQDVGTHMVALDPEGKPLAAAISLKSGPTAQLAFLAVDHGAPSRSMVRYALNAFVVQVAIESGAEAILLTGAAFSALPGTRVLATNCGYRARRILLDWDMRNPNEWAARALKVLAPPDGISTRGQLLVAQH
jgi:hypothetical protein